MRELIALLRGEDCDDVDALAQFMERIMGKPVTDEDRRDAERMLATLENTTNK